jgi:hypothetical protein
LPSPGNSRGAVRSKTRGGAFAAVPVPVMRSSASSSGSMRSELRAKASVNVLRLATVPRSGSAFSTTTLSMCRSTSRAACIVS